MNAKMPPKKNISIKKLSENWEIPNFEIKFSFPKKKRYCLVIPIINEGRRINEFLERLRLLSIEELLDIIIIDGGSNDGSIDEDYFKKYKINTLLLKKGLGKLSAQLRIAYSFAMLSEYEGIVTIDGNNKDDPKDIPEFINLLDQGYDFVQSSRFINGGKHKNTPLLRYFAIRFLHAPILSFASGFKWTDSTQGFRAYSKSLILSEEIGLFRSIFINYEILFYISYIAPRKNFKCIEHPSTRSYPKGKVPTKINNLKQYINIFISLIKVILGNYSL